MAAVDAIGRNSKPLGRVKGRDYCDGEFPGGCGPLLQPVVYIQQMLAAWKAHKTQRGMHDEGFPICRLSSEQTACVPPPPNTVLNAKLEFITGCFFDTSFGCIRLLQTVRLLHPKKRYLKKETKQKLYDFSLECMMQSALLIGLLAAQTELLNLDHLFEHLHKF